MAQYKMHIAQSQDVIMCASYRATNMTAIVTQITCQTLSALVYNMHTYIAPVQ